MLKNAMLFILAAFSLSGCANYSRPKNVAVKNSASNYPPLQSTRRRTTSSRRRTTSSRRIPITL